MKNLIIAAFCLLGSATSFSQTLKSNGSVVNSHYEVVGYYKDGVVKDRNYNTIGYIKSDGTIQDSHYSTIGYVTKDGTIKDGNYSTAAYVKKDGTTQNNHYEKTGSVSRENVGTPNMNIEAVLRQFFFSND